MHRIVARVRVCTASVPIARYSTYVRSITTTNYSAAKIGRTPPPTSSKTTKMLSPIDLTQKSGSEESDEDLKLAIAMSLSQQDNNNNSTSPKPAVVQPAKTGGLMGLDRKQMEAERLARQAQLKRKRGDEGKPISISPPPLSRRTRTRSPPSLSSPKKTTMAEIKTTNKTPQPAPPKSTLQFPNGIIKRTWISSHPRTDRDITFSELIDAPNLKSAVLSSFIWDFDWLFTQVRTKETRFVLVMHGEFFLLPFIFALDFRCSSCCQRYLDIFLYVCLCIGAKSPPSHFPPPSFHLSATPTLTHTNHQNTNSPIPHAHLPPTIRLHRHPKHPTHLPPYHSPRLHAQQTATPLLRNPLPPRRPHRKPHHIRLGRMRPSGEYAVCDRFAFALHCRFFQHHYKHCKQEQESKLNIPILRLLTPLPNRTIHPTRRADPSIDLRFQRHIDKQHRLCPQYCGDAYGSRCSRDNRTAWTQLGSVTDGIGG